MRWFIFIVFAFFKFCIASAAGRSTWLPLTLRGGSWSPPPEAVDLETTLVAIRYDQGVVVAADSRTSVSGYVSNRYAHKIAPVTSHCLVLRSGSAADTQTMAEECKQFFLQRSYHYGIQPTVSQIAHWMRQAVWQRPQGQVSLLVAGYDPTTQTPSLYSIAISGALHQEEAFAAAGSGSVFVLGYLDRELSENRVLSESEAINLCRQAISLAANRDGSSGGLVRISVIDAKGVRNLPPVPVVAATNDNLSSANLPGFMASSSDA